MGLMLQTLAAIVEKVFDLLNSPNQYPIPGSQFRYIVEKALRIG